MAHAAVEHLQQHVTAQPVRRDGVRGGAHHRGHRVLVGDARRDHARAQVAIGEDAERVAELDHDRCRRSARHPRRRFADRARRRAQQRRVADQRGHRLVGRVGGGLSRRERGGRVLVHLQQRARDEADALRSRQHRSRDLLGEAVAERVLVRARREPRRQPRQHRRVPEQLPGRQQVEHAVFEHDLDGAGADHAQVLDRLRALREDDRAGEEELDLGARRERARRPPARARRTAGARAGSP